MTVTVLDAPDILQAASYQQLDQIQVDAIRAHARQLGRPLSILRPAVASVGQRLVWH
jgi:hypothetical protein